MPQQLSSFLKKVHIQWKKNNTGFYSNVEGALEWVL